jgi:nuclear pore complex protein Nup205
MYDIKDEDIDSVADLSQFSTSTQQSPLQMQLPVLELLKVCAYCLLTPC